jgi:diaminohydroxyphosphoribosylaminopyrimidine deaminase/5-amino-6-(5-phosphoribosylamino)uracil reductase
MTFMARAIELGRYAQGTTSPNPPVGAVIVKDGEVVSEGWTQPPGGQHAEAMALERAGALAIGATLYTTLEPCTHFGRTPPCSDAIIKAHLAEVYVATVDPNPNVQGGGIDRLNQAGIATHIEAQDPDARELIEAFAKHSSTGMPFVIAKFAMSLDGKISTRTGDSKWISGEESRRYVHELRKQSDAILVGINTVLEDDPLLTARDENGSALPQQPLRVILDSHGRTPKTAKLLTQPGQTLIATVDSTSGDNSATVESLAFPSSDVRVDLSALLQTLGERDITSVFVEGGGTILGSLFDQRLVDKVVAFVSPVIIGGEKAKSPVGGLGSERISDAFRLQDSRIMQFGPDAAIIGYCKGAADVHRNS